MASFDTFLNSFDPDKKGIQFEYFVKWFLKNDPQLYTLVDEVWLWDEYPNKWGPDCGIDLVFRQKNGEICAVQAKCYDEKYSITKKDVDTFLSESSRQGIDKRLLIASTDQIGKNARQVCEAQEKPVSLYLLADFKKAAIDYPNSLSELNNAKRKVPPSPRLHQKEAIKDVIKGFESASRGQMIMACGTGKTFTTLWVKEALGAKTTLVLLPSLSLLSQTLWEWTFASSNEFEALCVCSDETVGKNHDEDSIVSSTLDVSFPTTTDTEEIKRFLKRDINKVIFSTYHSSPIIAEAQTNSNLPIFDLVVADEAHRCTGEVGNAFTTVLDDSLIKAKRRLFTTATPKTYTTNLKKKASEMGVDIADMSNEASFGREFHNLTFAQAIEKDLLTDYRVVIIGVDEPMIANWIDKRQLVRTDKNDSTDAKTLASQIGLIKAIKDYDLKRIITFHNLVKNAKLFASELHNAIDIVNEVHRPKGELYSDYVEGKMTSNDRVLRLSKLKTLHNYGIGLLANARCLSEGIDVPSLDGIAFIDPKNSQVDIIQAVGRAIRKSGEKAYGTIILPVFIEESDNPEKSIQSSNFKPIWGVLNALKSHDETLAFELNQIRISLGRQTSSANSSISFPEKIIFDLPTTVDSSFADSLKTILVDKVTDSWNFWFGLLEKFVEQEGHAMIPGRYKSPEGLLLGNWVNRQRSYKDKLNPERIFKLESINGWVWNTLEYRWEQGFSHLQAFVEKEGHSRVSARYITELGYRLGNWIDAQRQGKDNLTFKQINKLEALEGWLWSVQEFQWEEGFSNLQVFVEKEGHAMIPGRYKSPEGYLLGSWVNHQRSTKNKLTTKQIQRLESINGWVWDVLESRWEQGFSHLQASVEKEGHSRVSAKYITELGYRLGNWIIKQRGNKDKLTPERINRLEALEGWVWGMREFNWEEGFFHLKVFIKKEGHSMVPKTYTVEDDGYPLGAWVGTSRGRKDKLPKSILSRFDSLEGWVWNTLEYRWEQGFSHLQAFVEKEGHANIAAKYKTENGYELGGWISKQRSRKDKLTAEKKQRLESIDGWAWKAR